MGKLTNRDLKKLLRCIKRDRRVVVPPQAGFDSGVHLTNEDRYMVVSTDPCIGVPEAWFGWLLIHYVASDIALFGAKMEFCTINLLGPKTTKAEVFQKIMKQACDAADEIGTAVVTGHTGTYEGVSSPVGACTGYGHVEKEGLITPAGAQPRDFIVCVKHIGLETLTNFALTHEAGAEKLFGTKRARELQNQVPMQSCVKEAHLLAEIEGVHAMHDATEGGITAAMNELSEASNIGFKVKWKDLLVPEEVYILKDVYKLSDAQVLSMSSTGTILVAVSPTAVNNVVAVLRRNGIKGKVWGFFEERLSRVLVKDGKNKPFPRVADDPYARLFSVKH